MRNCIDKTLDPACDGIVIVEDEALLAADLEERIEGMGLRVLGTAVSGGEAVHLAGKTRPDLVIMDIYLKGEMDGIEAAEIIDSKYGLPVIFMSPFDDEDNLACADLSLPYGFLLKPVKNRNLKMMIKMALFSAYQKKERETAEKALQESMEKNRALINRTDDVLLTHDTEGNILSINPAAAKLFAYIKEKTPGRSIVDFVAPEFRGDFKEMYLNIIPDKKERAGAILNQDKEGNKRYFEYRITTFGEEKGEAVTSGIGRNGAEGYQNRLLLKDAESNYQSLFTDSPAPLWVEDLSSVKMFIDHLKEKGIYDLIDYFEKYPKSGLHILKLITIVDVNNAALNLYGVKGIKEFSQVMTGLSAKNIRREFQKEIVALSHGETRFETGFTGKTPDGKPFAVIFKMMLAPGYEETWEKVYLSVVDITPFF